MSFSSQGQSCTRSFLPNSTEPSAAGARRGVGSVHVISVPSRRSQRPALGLVWSKSWNSVEILIFGWNSEILSKSWNLVKNLKFANWVTKWHYLHWFRWLHLHCNIALDCPIVIISKYWVGIFISQSHISKVCKKSRQFQTPAPIDRTPGIPGSDKKTL